MKILFIAHPYLDLYKPIEQELLLQGHHVNTVIETVIPGDPYGKRPNRLKRYFKIKQFEKKEIALKYWKNKITNQVYNQYYDVLFVIQGLTFHPYLLEHLRKYNSLIKSSLYIWDSNSTTDFFRNARYFDKVFSFDYEDVKKFGNSKAEFLPFFWDKSILDCADVEEKYDICSIGVNHDNRFSIFNKVIDQVKKAHKKHYIRLIIGSFQPKLYIKEYFRYLFAIIFRDENLKKELDVKIGKYTCNWIESKSYSPLQFCEIMKASKAILDTDNPRQHGTTPRLIWALALNKHIFTTNTYIKKLEFYDSRYIHIISRSNPIIDFSVLESNYEERSSIEYLRIDNWIRNFL